MRPRHTPIAILLAATAAFATPTAFTGGLGRGGAATQSGHERPPLVAHEWGTFTSVAGEDGSAVEWLPQAGPSDLPCFVERNRLQVKTSLSGTVRMETPVLYFYASQDTTVNVNVRFRQGLMTEWFPRATVTPKGPNGPLPFGSPFESAIEWSDVRITPGVAERFPVETASSHYYAARRTDASPLEVGSQKEKFLFYRGVGRFEVPLSVARASDGTTVVTNRQGGAVGDVLLFENRGGAMTFQFRDEPSVRAVFDRLVPRTPPDAGPIFKSGATEPALPLSQELARVLVAHGLYPKEAEAMVETWRDSWFEEGVRLIYIAPGPLVDGVLPLDITPRPTDTSRVFVGRIELFTPAILQEVKQALEVNERATLQKYGRFLQPIGNRVVAGAASAERAALERTLQSVFSSWVTPATICQ